MGSTNPKLIVQHGDQQLGRYELSPGQYLVGCDPTCDLHIEVPGIADRHLRLNYTGALLELEDLGSPTGTLLNGHPLRLPVRLTTNGFLQLGAVRIEIRFTSASTESSTAPVRRLVPTLPVLQKKARERVYEIDREVARGGMGAVLRAKDLNIKRPVALKVVLDESAKDPRLLQRFVQEAELTGQLEHPNIVPVHDLSFDEQGQAFYTMKFVQGVTLQDVLTRLKAGDAATVAQYPLVQLLTIFQKICDAMAFAHAKGVVHRDLKPPNIMLGDYGEVLVMDWGLAKVVGKPEADPAAAATRLESQAVGLTLAGAVMGSPLFMAPEQAAGRAAEIDARTDIFALGGMLYNILTLHPPVTGTTVAEVLGNIIAGKIVPPTAYNPQTARRPARSAPVAPTTFPKPPLVALPHCPGGRVPESLAAVAMKAMALNRGDRYQSVAELQKDITAFQGGFATGAEHASAWRQLVLLIKRHRTEFTLAATALLVLVVTVTGFMVKVVHERNRAETERARAETNLESLRKTAPAFYNQALGALRDLKFEAALESIQYAIELRPTKAEYHVFKGNLLQTGLRMDEARAAYRAALAQNPNHALAQANIKLCDKLETEYAQQQQKWTRPTLFELQSALVDQQRFDEARSLMSRAGKNPAQARIICEAALGKSSLITPDTPGAIRIILRTADLSRLKGLPIDELWIQNRQVSDLSPLRGMELTCLSIGYTSVSDLRPLIGMPLRKLWMNETKVTDLSPLQGMPLVELDAFRLSVTNLAPLAGMPLVSLRLNMCPQVADLTPLTGLPLTNLDIGATAVSDLRPLQGMHLKRLMCNQARVFDLSQLRDLPLESFYISSCPITDLSPLQGMHLKTLEMGNIRISDLSSLRGMPLEVLTLTGFPVTDLNPLRGMPLKEIGLDACNKLQDLTPLLGCPQLERVWLPQNCKNIECLRSHPSIKMLGYAYDLKRTRTTALLPAADFWKTYDAEKKVAGPPPPPPTPTHEPRTTH